MARHIHVQEKMRERCRLSSIRHNRLIQKQVAVMDLKSIPMIVEWAALKRIQGVIQLDQAYYPEIYESIIFINAPMYFTAIWAIIKPWLDPLVLQRVQIHGTNYYDALKQSIDEEVIPVELGGKNTNFSWVAPTNCTDI